MKELKLHHIGVATKSISKEIETFEMLGYSKISEVFSDPIQKIKGIFISAKNQPTLELLENLTEDGPLNLFLKNRTKFYHFAYITQNIEQDLEYFIKEYGSITIVPITKATYFKKICFMLLPNHMIIELVQERSEHEQ